MGVDYVDFRVELVPTLPPSFCKKVPQQPLPVMPCDASQEVHSSLVRMRGAVAPCYRMHDIL